MQEVAAFGRVPKELYHAVTDTGKVAYKLARTIRKKGLQQAVREMFEISIGEDAIVRQITQEVAAFGRVPKELYRPVTETEIAAYKLARRVRQRGLRKEVQEMFEKLTSKQGYLQRQLIPCCRWQSIDS